MAMWTETTKAEVRTSLHRSTLTAHKFLAYAKMMAAGKSAPDLKALLTHYVEGVCSFWDHLSYEIRGAINEVGFRAGVLPQGDSFFDGSWEVKRDILSTYCPQLVPAVYTMRDNTDVERILLLEPTANDLADDNLPLPMNILLRQLSRPCVYAYTSRDASLYVHPFRYQVLSKDQTAMWASGSPRPLSRIAVGRPDLMVLNQDIIILQDRFDCTNFAHFLFDSITRALLLREHMGTLTPAILVFGGVPGAFHDVLCSALAEAIGLEENSIYFPTRDIIIQSTHRCFWFSDQVESYVHPAQMAHPDSVGLLRSLAHKVTGDVREQKRIYISRADAERRRLANEDEIVALLSRYGFASVQLSKLSARQQIGLFRDAELIVAPHGMGLAHLAFAERLKGVVELFPPNTGSDTYAFIAKALGLEYQFVIGTDVDNNFGDFSVDGEEIICSIDRLLA